MNAPLKPRIAWINKILSSCTGILRNLRMHHFIQNAKENKVMSCLLFKSSKVERPLFQNNHESELFRKLEDEVNEDFQMLIDYLSKSDECLI